MHYFRGVIVCMFAMCVVMIRAQSDSTYLDPNKFIHSNQENERIQTRLRDYLQQNPDTDVQNPEISRDLLNRFQQQNQDPRYDSTRYRTGDTRNYETSSRNYDDRDRDRYADQNVGRRQQNSQRFETPLSDNQRYYVKESDLGSRSQGQPIDPGRRLSDQDRYITDEYRDRERERERDRPYNRDRDQFVRGGQQSRFLDSGFGGQQLGGGAPTRGKTFLPDSELRRFLHQIDLAASQQCTNNVIAQWEFETNVNEATQVRAVSFYLSILSYGALKVE